MRGEDRQMGEAGELIDGSPPHARGRHLDAPARQDVQGITPACAGKTRRQCRIGSQQADHPRMRGEDF